MEFVAFLGNDKENWGQILALSKRVESKKVLLVKGKNIEGFPLGKNCEFVNVDTNKTLLDLKKEIFDKLKPLLSGDFEVSLSLASGSGKEHMALISALLSIPVGIRLVAYTKEGIEYIN